MSSPAATRPNCGRTATRSTTRTSATPAPASSSMSSRRMDQREAVHLRRQILPGRERLLAGEAVSQRAAFRSSSAAARMPRSRSRASMPTRLRCGANPMRRCATSPSRVRAAAAKHGRPTPRFSLSVRPILADTEEKAWAKADEILARATALQDKTGYRKPADGHATAGARRLLALADQGTPHRQAAVDRDRQSSPAPTATPPRWSARPSRSPKCSATITISASAIS